MTAHKIIRTTALLCAGALLLSADTLVLRNGGTVQGTYLGGDTRQIRMDQNGAIQNYDIGQVQSVIFNNETGYQAPPPPRERDRGDRDRGGDRDRDRGAANYPPPAQTYGNGGVFIPADTEVKIRMIDGVDSESAYTGQTFRASLDEPIYVNGQAVVPRGADVMTKLVAAQQSGKIEGRAALTLALSSITINGRPVDVTTTDVREESGSRGKRSAGVIGGGAALGAIIGAVAGGGKGAAIGAGSGAAIGTGAEVLTSGQKVRIPSETRLTFRLQAPIQQ